MTQLKFDRVHLDADADAPADAWSDGPLRFIHTKRQRNGIGNVNGNWIRCLMQTKLFVIEFLNVCLHVPENRRGTVML